MTQEEREKEYNALKDKAQQIAGVIQSAIGNDTSLFDLCVFSAMTLMQAAALFPKEYGMVFAKTISECITLSYEAKKAEAEGVPMKIEQKRKQKLFDSYGNIIN